MPESLCDSHRFSEARNAAAGPWEEPEEPADEQLWSEFCELYPEGDEPSSDERGITAETVLRPKCSRCIIFRDNCVHYLNAISDLSPRITALEALKPENKMLKKLNADLTTQLEEGMQVEQTLKARVAAAEEETTKVKAALESLEKDYDAMAKAAAEGKKHANEASVWRVKYEKTVDICERIQERRKKETANFDKMLNLAEGYKKELEATKAKVLEDRQQNILFMEASRKHIPSLFTLLKDITANPAFKTMFPTSVQDEAARLCSPNVKKALRVHDHLDDEDHMTEELEKLVCAGPSSVPTIGLSQRSGSNISAEFLENNVARPESARPTAVAPDFVLSELNDEEADNLLAAGAEAATIAASVSRVAGRGGRGRGGGSRRGRGSKQVHTPAKFGASVDHDELARRYNEMLDAKLKRGEREASEPCSSGLKHMSIHGKKTVSIREQQEAQMKVSIKEKVALMKKLDGTLKKTTETLDDEDPALEKDLQTSDAPKVGPQNDKDVSPTKSKTDFSLARDDLLLSASPSPASSIAEGETNRRVDADAVDLLALEEFGNVDQEQDSRDAELGNDGPAAMVMEDYQPPGDVDLAKSQQQAVTVSGPLKEDDSDRQPMDSQDHSAEVLAEEPMDATTLESLDYGSSGGIEEEPHGEAEVAFRDVESEEPEKTAEQINSVEEAASTGEAMPTADIPSSPEKIVKSSIENHEAEIGVVAAESAPTLESTTNESADVAKVSQVEQVGDKKEVVSKVEKEPALAEAELSQSLAEQASDVAEKDNVAQVFVKPPKPHLAKDTKRALGLMRRLEVDLKQKVEPIPEFSGKSKKRSSREEQLRADTTPAASDSTTATTASPAKSESASLASEPKDPATSATHELNEEPHPMVGESRADPHVEESASSGSASLLEPSIIEKDHEEAMRLHAQLNHPSLRRREVEYGSRDSLTRRRPSKSDVLAKEQERKTSQTDATGVNATHVKEIASKLESKSAKSKESPATEQNDVDDDLVGSILAGARTNTVEPAKVSHGQQETASALPEANSKSSVKNVSSTVPKESTGPAGTVGRGSRRSQIPESAHAKADAEQKLGTTVVASSESSAATSHVLRSSQKNTVAPAAAAIPKSSIKSPDFSGNADQNSAVEEKVQRRGRGRPRRVSGGKTQLEQGGPEEELKSPPRKTGTRSRASALTTPTPSRPSSQDGSSEEDVPPRRGGKHGKVESTASEPHFTRSTRSRTESLTSPTSSRRSSRLNSAESEQASSTRKISSSQEAQKLEKKQQSDRKKRPTPPSDEKSEKGKRDRGDGKDLASQGDQNPRKEQLKADEGNGRGLRKRSFQNVEAFPVSPPPLSSKRLKTLSVQLNIDASPASRTRTKVDTTSTPIEALEYEPHSRVKSRTGPVAPKKRKTEDESSQKKSAPTADTLSEESTDDEDRLCVAVDEEEEELPPQASQKSALHEVEHDEDEEERLVIDAEEDENGEEEGTAKKSEGGGDTVSASELSGNAGGEAKVPETTENSQNDEDSESPPVSAKTRKASSQSVKVLPSSDETPQSGPRSSASSAQRERVGALQAARRSMLGVSAGPAAMQKFSARLAKQLQKGGAVTRTPAPATRSSRTAAVTSKELREADTSSPPTPVQPKVPSRRDRGSTVDTPKHAADVDESATPKSNNAGTVRGSKRRPEGPVHEIGSVVKKAAPSESALQKKLHGALLSEQKIEVIRKTLGEDVHEIAKMDPEDFAATMVKCSLNLPSGDMWTIVQGNHRCSEPVDIHNKKENAFVSIARELSGNAHVWVEYVKKMVTTMAGQTPNVVSSTRYVRLLCQALCQAGNLLTNEEKKSYLRAALTRIFLDDTGIAIKATTYVLLSSSYELLDWMNDKNDPFSLLISLAVTAAQSDGKILLWAWFQQFSQELQLHDVSATNLRKALDELWTHLDKLAEERIRDLEQNGRSTKITQEEITILNIATAYFFTGSAAVDVIKGLVGGMLTESIDRIKAAMKPRATEGERAWSEAAVVSNRLMLCVNLVFKGLGYRDNSALSREFCELLQHNIPAIRDLRDEVEKLSPTRPWMETYLEAIQSVLVLVNTISRYEI
ncbi:hypothetical protein ANCCAN_10243 [Ancylostoma caninum]|uniref:Uncharacterized protein n=1 Tax=Ancylostoma caninum TaxID=29170 RepID=A0A368GHB2_ANCCA|nr:hypothetical protein ANCCAN_10243 [Ancylostoma caninum]